MKHGGEVAGRQTRVYVRRYPWLKRILARALRAILTPVTWLW